MSHSILLSFDIEDWFQVENLRSKLPPATWTTLEYRVEKNTNKILSILDEYNIKATFFVLGWVAALSPQLIKLIHRQGHEIASHGYDHSLNYSLEEKDLMNDLSRSKALLEEITGVEIKGYRAPCFSINQRVIACIARAGYTYDSSLNSFKWHDRYGSLTDGDSDIRLALIETDGGHIFEVPLSNLKWQSLSIPWSGGGYFRLLPESLFSMGTRLILRKYGTYAMYLHPWEFDPGQPRVNGVPLFYCFRHYVGLKKTEAKLRRFLDKFRQTNFLTFSDHIEKANLNASRISLRSDCP